MDNFKNNLFILFLLGFASIPIIYVVINPDPHKRTQTFNQSNPVLIENKTNLLKPITAELKPKIKIEKSTEIPKNNIEDKTIIKPSDTKKEISKQDTKTETKEEIKQNTEKPSIEETNKLLEHTGENTPVEETRETPKIEETIHTYTQAYSKLIENGNDQIIVLQKDQNDKTIKTIFTLMFDKDPSIIKIGNIYYIAVTNSYSGGDFNIYKTKDFHNFDSIQINANLLNFGNKIVKPNFFIDKNNYLSVIVSVNSKENPDKFIPYTMNINIETGEPSNIQEINIDDFNRPSNKVFKYNEDYYLLSKNDSKDELELLISSNLTDWENISNKMPDLGNKIENYYFMEMKNKIKIIFENEEGIYWIETSNFNEFSNREKYENSNTQIATSSIME